GLQLVELARHGAAVEVHRPGQFRRRHRAVGGQALEYVELGELEVRAKRGEIGLDRADDFATHHADEGTQAVAAVVGKAQVVVHGHAFYCPKYSCQGKYTFLGYFTFLGYSSFVEQQGRQSRVAHLEKVEHAERPQGRQLGQQARFQAANLLFGGGRIEHGVGAGDEGHQGVAGLLALAQLGQIGSDETDHRDLRFRVTG